ncbi:MAG: flagellar basal-body MS-ring/collar protein FliF [Clostridia bacterium]|nr:flagellar basal-body MS-ring/collar protein FliF [Clostridia bacterium]
MPEMLSRMQQQVVEFWKNLEKSQRNRILITSAILLAAITIGIYLLTKPNYMTLIKNADPKEVGEMTKILDDKKVWNKVENNGGNIVIYTKDNNTAQAALVQNGYPKSNNFTFEDAFKMIKLNTTESDKKKLWEEYKAKSLAAKLKSLDNVEYADVTLTMPEPSPFVTKDEQKPTANIMVKPKGELTGKQVEGIKLMVARSVENLNPKDISVIDNNGNPLGSEGNEIDAPGTQYEMKQKVKKELEKSVRDLFNGQFDNFDAIRVVANPVLDFNKEVKQIKEITNPQGLEGGATISKEETKETLKNDGASGAPGTDSNPGNTNSPSYQMGNNPNSSYNKQTSKVNNEFNETQTSAEKALGAMDAEKSSMTVSLLYGTRVTDDTKITPELIAQIQKSVSDATGIQASKVSVNKFKVAPPVEPKKPMSETVKEIFNTYGMFALILVLMIALVIMAIPRKKREPAQELAAQGAGAGNVTGPKFIVPEGHEVIPEIDLEERSEVKKQIEKFVKQKPDAVAQLLRNWLADEWD